MHGRPLSLGIVGAGIMGERILKAVMEEAGSPVRIAAVWDPSPAARARVAATYPGVPLVADAAAVVAASECVYVASPPASHLGHARLALAAGRSVFCEKPLAIDRADARAFVAAAGKAGAVNFPFASSPGVAAIERWIAQGAVGTPRRLTIELGFAAWPRPWQARCRALARPAGGRRLHPRGRLALPVLDPPSGRPSRRARRHGRVPRSRPVGTRDRRDAVRRRCSGRAGGPRRGDRRGRSEHLDAGRRCGGRAPARLGDRRAAATEPAGSTPRRTRCRTTRPGRSRSGGSWKRWSRWPEAGRTASRRWPRPWRFRTPSRTSSRFRPDRTEPEGKGQRPSPPDRGGAHAIAGERSGPRRMARAEIRVRRRASARGERRTRPRG